MKKTPALWKEELLIFPALRKTNPALWKEELLIFPAMKFRIQMNMSN